MYLVLLDLSSDDLHCGSQQVWGKTKSKLYGPEAGEDFQDNQLRFSILCQVTNLIFLLRANHLFSLEERDNSDKNVYVYLFIFSICFFLFELQIYSLASK